MKKHSVDMTEGSILKHLILFAIPMIISSIVQKLYSTADMAVLSKFVSEEAFAAVGSTSSAVNLIINMVLGFAIASSITMSKMFGAKDNDGMSRTMHTSLFIAMGCGIVLGLLGIIVTKPLLTAMNCPKELLSMAALYMQLYFVGLPFAFFTTFASTMLRSVGNVAKPTSIQLISGLINVILNVVFVVLFRMEIAGVAIATILSQIYSATAIYFIISRTDEGYRFSFKKLRFYKDVVKDFLHLGIPTCLQRVATNVSNVLIQSSVNAVGTVAVVANSASTNLEGYITLVINVFYYGMVAFLGQNFGARNYDRMKKGVRIASLSTIVTGILLTLIMGVFSSSLLSIFTTNPEIIRNASQRMMIMIVFAIVSGVGDIAVAGLRVMGKSFFISFVTIAGSCGVISLVALLCGPYRTWSDLLVIYGAYPVVGFVMTVIFVAMFFAVLKKKRIENN